jgi:hypothetical protein
LASLCLRLIVESCKTILAGITNTFSDDTF